MTVKLLPKQPVFLSKNYNFFFKLIYFLCKVTVASKFTTKTLMSAYYFCMWTVSNDVSF